MSVTQKVTLYNNKFTVPPVINAVQNDTDRLIEAYFGDFTLQVGMTGVLSFIRSDRTHYEVSATLDTATNTATAELDQALTQEGTTHAQLKITDSGNVGSTFTFMIKVQPDVAGISVEQDGWSAQEFDQRLTDAENAIDAVEEDVEDLQEKVYDYAPVITDTASGAIATFPDGADGYPLKECVVDVDAVQDLHGYDHPWPAGGGVNKFLVSQVNTTASGITATINPDGCSVTINGTATAAGGINILVADRETLPNGDYYYSASNGARLLMLRRAGGQSRWINSGTVVTVGDTDYPGYTYIGVNIGDTFNNVVVKVQLNNPSTVTSWSPYSNECPITGWSEAKVTRSGKNLLPMPITSGSYAYTMSVSVNADKSFYVTKTSSSGWASFTLATNYLLKAGTYALIESDDGSANSTINVYKAGTSTLVTDTRYTKNRVFTITEDTLVDMMYSRSDVADNVLTKLMLFSDSSLTATAYEPYNGQTVTIDLDGTRYGGTLDVVSGKLKVTHAYKVLNGTETWYAITSPANGFRNSGSTDFPGRKSGGEFICNRLYDKGNSLSDLTNTWDAVFASNLNIRTDSLFADADAFKTWVASNNLQCVYELETPVEVDLTATEITTLLGTNNIFSSTGDVSVTYACDTRKFIEKLISQLA